MKAELSSRGHLIHGEEVPAASGAQFDDIDPSTCLPFARFALHAKKHWGALVDL